MGKRQSKISSSAAAASSGSGNGDSKDYILLVKADWCGACKQLSAMLDRMPNVEIVKIPKTQNILSSSGGKIFVHEIRVEDVQQYPEIERLVDEAYGFYPKSKGSIPLMMIVRGGRLTRAETRLGSFRQPAELQAFLQRL